MHFILSIVSREREMNWQAASVFCARGAPQPAVVQPAVRDGGGDVSALPWMAAPDAMPHSWPERDEWRGRPAREAAAAELRYISSRRAEPESGDQLAREAMPKPTVPLSTRAQPACVDVSWPDGAPLPPVSIDQLFEPGVYDELLRSIGEAAASLGVSEECVQRGEEPRVMPARPPEVYAAASCQPTWARARVWFTRDPANCVPVTSFSREEPPVHDLNPHFLELWGRRLAWPDEDMSSELRGRAAQAGPHMVLHTHHLGLREHYAVARASVESDTAEGWISAGAPHLQFVPSRLVPKNVVSQSKWRLGANGCVSRLLNRRVTTDDSVLPAEGLESRNETIDREDLSNVSLPTIQQLARAVAKVQATASRWGVHVPSDMLRHVAVWALDLTSAYRRAARHE
ncbi:MAG: hypothetical protein SGPRY_013449 [Prymnesium sp.]